jgi:hypothetical protein
MFSIGDLSVIGAKGISARTLFAGVPGEIMDSNIQLKSLPPIRLNVSFAVEKPELRPALNRFLAINTGAAQGPEIWAVGAAR